MDLIKQLRQNILGKTLFVHPPQLKADQYQFLGTNKEERLNLLIKKVIGGQTSVKRKIIFEYIIDFWERSTIEIGYREPGFKGLNLAKRPFLTPTGSNDGSSFAFGEQYRWDTYFQNKGLILAGGFDLAFGQIMNLIDVFQEFKRIPNALSTPFLSRPQPPFEMAMIMDLLKSGFKHNEEIKLAVNTVEEEMVTEWFDYGTGKQNSRQSKELVEKYGLLTRYEPHSNPFIVGCEDGKDHNWITATYSFEYLPVQLNAILYGAISLLLEYYSSSDWGNDASKAELYSNYKKKMYLDFQNVFWCEEGKWKGFRNYSLLLRKEGYILYGDLSSEVFPLFFKLATPFQAEIIKRNLSVYYEGDIGFATTSLLLRDGGSIPTIPVGQWKFQWEYPNCWPPLMLLAVEGLKNYGYKQEALQYEKNWITYVEDEFDKISGFAEKYPYSREAKVEPGFYGIMKGFGWTIGVYLQFIHDLSREGLLH
ncbi:hypothetical protein COY87_00620 [Candidatus Roizmanbacteria bacterium CG_4_10_14_0_8_um_filter_33_9]|uniref:Trehalase n=1 Tax=Candidatus Roizmanbacteria bacterium CG_4_10_14_0_8_um_filter_33_9 TaxID=1974826 RepID=A0A2M7QKP7_9BACT|nr:MAG: hypothetical protein COY87_00620 [Candidatus Roizmanbacteria bacterium CG_4_10_14_0_8_um_filter_33_9]